MKNDSSRLQLHALSSGLKAYITSTTERMAQVCRVACGGHGFLVGSGLVGIRNLLDASCTIEGDNVVLLQQTARYSPSLRSAHLLVD